MRRSALVVLLLVVAVGCGGGRGGDGGSEEVGIVRLSLRGAGFAGTLAVPDGSGRRPAVVVLGGSDGRRPTQLAEVLAGKGYVSLALSYFAAPGLPDHLEGVRLEYFQTALRWLRQRADVESHHVIVWGASRGGEAALLIAATYPELVDGVIAAVPSNVVTCGFPTCGRAAWTLHGEPLPYVDEFDGDYYDQHPEAEIPAERIAGPVLLICGGRDLVWPSCPMSHAIIDRLDRNGQAFDHKLLEYPDAGHDFGAPGRPLTAEQARRTGGTVETNHAALKDAWPKALAFLAYATTNNQ